MTSETEFGVTAVELDELMSLKGAEGLKKLQEMGGVEELCNKLRTSPIQGVTGEEEDLKRRRAIYGSNIIPPKKSTSFLALVWEALQDTTLIILEIAAVISLALSFHRTTERLGAQYFHISENLKMLRKVIGKLVCRYDRCFNVHGDYVEN